MPVCSIHTAFPPARLAASPPGPSGRSLAACLFGLCSIAAFLVSPALLAQRRFNLEGLGRLPAFSHAVVSGDLVFVSGTLGTNAETLTVVDGIGGQTRQALHNVERILAGTGSTLADLVRCTVFLTDLSDFDEMNRAWIEVLGASPPARTTVQVAGLVLGAKIELECTAQLNNTAQHNGTAPAGAASLQGALLEQGFFEHDGERFYFESAGPATAGEDSETIVLTHGYGGNHAVWFQQVPAFASTWRVVTWDHRGFGRSTNRAGKADFATFAEDLRALLDHLKIQSAHLVGQSMGGWTVVVFAERYPERARSLVLADTLAGLYTPGNRETFLRLLQGNIPDAAALPLHRHPAIDARFSEENPAAAFLYRELAGFADPPPSTLPGEMLNTVTTEQSDRLTMPTLFVVGERDTIFPPSSVAESAALVSGANLAIISSAGHSAYFEKAGPWNARVLSFLRVNAHR